MPDDTNGLSLIQSATRNSPPFLLASDGRGNVFDIPELKAAGMRLSECVRPKPDEWIPLPEGSTIMELPGRRPIGAGRKQFVTLSEYKGNPVAAVAAFVAPAYTQLYHAAYETEPGAPTLPLFAYSPAGWRDGKFWTTAVRVDGDVRHDASQFDARLVEKSARRMLRRHAGNRLVEHLVRLCVRRYRCPNAMNFVLERWECPVPVSPACNAGCVGCISKQSKTGVPSTQNRISFTPTTEEILEYAAPHLRSAERAMISFGQGCEGEPLLKSGLIEKTIRRIRCETGRGTVHLNTNAGDPDAVERLFKAGLDSIRVSLNSARPEYYQKYHRPKGFGFEDVLNSLERARKAGAWISLNYFIFPGFTDLLEETEALAEIVREFRVDFIQTRNLNIDPEWVVKKLGLDPIPRQPAGILQWMKTVRKKAPWIRFGYFNPPKEAWGRGR
jgi:pyruvate-formate lyase-activating enzyme